MVTTRMMAFGTLSAIVLSSTLSLAAEIRATASPDGYLLVEGTQLLSDACLSLDDVRQGSPEGAAEISNAQAFTLRISHSGDDMCAQVVSEAPFSVRVRDDRYRPFVILYREYEGFPAHLPANVSRTWGEISAKGVLEQASTTCGIPAGVKGGGRRKNHITAGQVNPVERQNRHPKQGPKCPVGNAVNNKEEQTHEKLATGDGVKLRFRNRASADIFRREC